MNLKYLLLIMDYYYLLKEENNMYLINFNDFIGYI